MAELVEAEREMRNDNEGGEGYLFVRAERRGRIPIVVVVVVVVVGGDGSMMEELVLANPINFLTLMPRLAESFYHLINGPARLLDASSQTTPIAVPLRSPP